MSSSANLRMVNLNSVESFAIHTFAIRLFNYQEDNSRWV
jgi:hypothetical protein